MKRAGIKALLTFFDGSIYSISKLFFSFIVLDRKVKAIPENADKLLTNRFANYLQST